MVTITCNGKVLTDVRVSTTRSGVPRSEFIIECESPNSLPLRFAVAFLGNTAVEMTSALRPGAKVLVYGRMCSNRAGNEKRTSILASFFEVLAADATDNVFDFVGAEAETEKTK